MKEGLSGQVEIKNLEFAPLKAAVKFMYSPTIDLKTLDFALKVLVAADFCDVAGLKAVANYITLKLNTGNAFLISDSARQSNSPQLVIAASRLISEQLAASEVSKDDRQLKGQR